VIRVERLLLVTRKLAEPTGNATTTFQERRSLIVTLTDHLGHIGLGEAAPLPAYSRDTFEENTQALRALAAARFADLEPGASAALVLETALPESLPHAARHALESALLDLWSRAASVPAFRLLAGDASAARVELACLLPADERIFATARREYQRGFRSFKLKLGVGRSLLEDISRLERLRAELPAGAQLRVDGNRQQDGDVLVSLAPRLSALALEWIEEPTRDVISEPELGLPIALDESLLDGPDLARASSKGARYVVLKPSLLGGFARCLALAERARGAGLVPVASHQFEGPLGFQSAAALALALGAGRPADGLGPHLGLGSSLPPSLTPEGTAIVRWDEPGLAISLEAATERASVEAVV
jgi:o-succinylbenzoate synthase